MLSIIQSGCVAQLFLKIIYLCNARVVWAAKVVADVLINDYNIILINVCVCVCVLCICRYIAVTQPIKYAKHKNNRRVWLTIVLVWAISAAIGTPIVLGLNNTPDRIPDLCLFYNSNFIIYSSLSSFYIPCIIMVFLYWNIFKVSLTWYVWYKINRSNVFINSKLLLLITQLNMYYVFVYQIFNKWTNIFLTYKCLIAVIFLIKAKQKKSIYIYTFVQVFVVLLISNIN